jgi:hypothetical protein
MKNCTVNWVDEALISYYFSYIYKFIFDRPHESLKSEEYPPPFIKELIFCSFYVLYIPHTRKG